MNYIELSKEYIRQYEFLSKYVKKLNMDFEIVSLNLDFKRRSDYKRRIYLIYTMCLELKHTGEYLKKCEKRDKILE